MKIKNFRIRAGIGPKPTISLGKWQSGPSPGTPRAKEKIKNHFKHSQDDSEELQAEIELFATPGSQQKDAKSYLRLLLYVLIGL